MQEVTPLTQILPLVAAGASALLALGAEALSGIFFLRYTRLNSRAEDATGLFVSSTTHLAQLYEQMYRDSLVDKQNNGPEQEKMQVQIQA